MTDARTPDEGLPADATAVEQIIPAEQPPMDDAAGPSDDEPDTSEIDDLSVQGGE